MFAVFATVFCLMSVSHSAPPACDSLVRPLDQLDFHHLEGRWALVAGSLSDPAHLENFKRRNSASVKFANASETFGVSFTRIFSFADGCQYLHADVSLEGSGFIFQEFNLTVTFVYTSCPDCVVMRFDTEAKKLLRCYLFSRRRQVEQGEMEEFRAQAECLDLLPPAVMDPTKELCPEEAVNDPAGHNEEKAKPRNA